MMRYAMLLTAAAALILAGPLAAGEITGTIVFEGEPPTMRPIDMSADPVCAEKRAGETVRNQALVLGEGQTMANVFVEITGGLPEKAWPVPEEPRVLTQDGCVYKPHVFGIMAGQPLEIRNPDGTLHNVNAMPRKNMPFNIGMPRTMTETQMTFEKPEPMFAFRCDVHPWMRAYCVVTDHPFYDVTDKDGMYKIADLPPGEYEVSATHEKLGTKTATVVVKEDAPATADFTFARP